MNKKRKRENESNGIERPVYKVGDRMQCKWTKDNQNHPCEIIELRLNEESQKHEYYVHYLEFNRRLDEWVTSDRFVCVLEKGYTIDKGAANHKAGRTRNQKRKNVDDNEKDDHSQHDEISKVKNINTIEFGKYMIDTWYFSPYPEEYAKSSRLYICEFCLKYMKKKTTLLRHKEKCNLRHPPGNEIYRKDGLSMFEVDGSVNRIYCQNICLLAKLFLDHKTLYYDVEPFLFYVLTEVDDKGCHMVGYFSKEKNSPDDFNLACILILPPFQRKGFGKFLIAFSYELSKLENKVGTPEKPLSDLGLLSYRSYWTEVILSILKEHKGNLSIKDISARTSIKTEDIISTLQSLHLIKYWKGQHIISVTPKVVEEHMKNFQRKTRLVDTDALKWVPPIQQTDKKNIKT
jgi:histone acetyltransferase MYST1